MVRNFVSPGLRGKSTAISQVEYVFLLHREWLCSKTTRTIRCENDSPVGVCHKINTVSGAFTDTVCISSSVSFCPVSPFQLPKPIYCALWDSLFIVSKTLQSKHFFFTFFLQCKPGSPGGFWLPCSILRWSLYISLRLRWRLERTWKEGKILTASLSNFRNFPFLLPNNSPNWFLCTRCLSTLIVVIIVPFLEQSPFTHENSSKFED